MLRIILLCFLSISAFAQPWSGILDPTRAIDWTQAGIPGGIPDASWTQSGSTILAATYGNGAFDATAGIQAALGSCGTNQYVLLGTGTFRINTNLSVPSNCVLRGSGPNNTKLDAHGSGNYVVLVGTDVAQGGNIPVSSHTAISSGATAGSTSFVVASASGISVGNLIQVSQTTEPAEVNDQGTSVGTPCTWCNEGVSGMGFAGQTVVVTSVSGTTIGFRPPLYWSYTGSPQAFPFNYGGTNAGIEALKVSGNQTGFQEAFEIGACKYCWIANVESDFSDGDHVEVAYSIGSVVRDSFFHDGYIHYGGNTDNCLRLIYKSSSNLVENNIFWRDHLSILSEWGSSGNVIAYNYTTGNYHDSCFAAGCGGSWQIEDYVDNHGAHSMFNLWEGNIGDHFEADDLWGTSSRSTLYRNWFTGSRVNYPPIDARGALQTGSPTQETQNEMGLAIDSLATKYNIVGTIIGSAFIKSQGVVNQTLAPNGAGSTNYGFACQAWGFDSNNQNIDSTQPFSTSFIHGVNNCLTNALTWSGVITHTLPSSFYLSGEPKAWWKPGSALLGTPTPAWPPIGPDVTGGTVSDAVSHGWVNMIPAMLAYNYVTANGTNNNTGLFNAKVLYANDAAAAADYVDNTVLLLAAGKGLTISNSGIGGSNAFTPTLPLSISQRIKWWGAVKNIPTRGIQTTCADPCAITMNRNWGQQYSWCEVVDLSGNSYSPSNVGPHGEKSPALCSRQAYPQIQPPAASPGSWTFPIEVIGQDQYATAKQVTVPGGSVTTGLRLYLRGHSLGYRGQLPADGKCSVQLNNGAWTGITNANVTGIGELSYYGGIGAFIHLQDFTLPISDGTITTGTNTVNWRFNGDDGVTSGCRVRDFNFWEPSQIITQIVVTSGVTITATATTSASHGYVTGNWVNIQGAPGIRGRFNGPRLITVTDPTHFTFAPCGTNPDLLSCTAPNGTYVAPTSQDSGTVQPVISCARQIIPQSAYTQEDPTTWTAPPGGDPVAGKTFFDSQALVNPNSPYLNYTLPVSTCKTCHANSGASTGFDLKFFNYSNWVLKQRTIRHGGTGQDGDNVAAYIRTLPITVPPMGRPWNPAYQPCPGLDSNPVGFWAAGGGADCVQTYSTDWTEYACPSGSCASWAANSWLNMRELPEQYPFFDWNDHLPPIFPGDYFPSFNASSVPTYYNNAVAAIVPGNVASYTGYDNSMATFRDQIITFKNNMDVARPLFAAPGYIRPSLYSVALQSIIQWGIVKSWEIVHGGNFEGNLDSVYTARYGPSTNGYQSRGWYSGLHFYLANHISGLPPAGIGSYDSSAQSYNVQSNIAYVYQVTVDCGNRRLSGNSPWDIGYTWIFLSTGGAQWRANDFVADLAWIKGPQCSFDDPNLFPQAGSSFNIQTIISASSTIQLTGNVALRFTTPAQRLAKNTQLAKTLTAVLNNYTPTQWANNATGLSACTNATNGALQSLSVCDTTMWLLPLFNFWNVDSATLNSLVTAANSAFSIAFPSHNFATDLAATQTGTWTCGGSALNPLIGNMCKPDYPRFSNQP